MPFCNKHVVYGFLRIDFMYSWLIDAFWMSFLPYKASTKWITFLDFCLDTFSNANCVFATAWQSRSAPSALSLLDYEIFFTACS